MIIIIHYWCDQTRGGGGEGAPYISHICMFHPNMVFEGTTGVYE